MYLKKLEELSRYLVVNDSNSDEICRFLNFEIFGYLQSRAIYFAQLTNDGYLQPAGDFGFTKGSVDSWGAFSLTFDIPITAAVKQNTCIHVTSPEDLYAKYPLMKEVKNIDNDWASILAVPVHAYGVYSITSFKQPELDEVHEGFLRTVGQLASVAFSKSQMASRLRGKTGKVLSTSKKSELTSRQELIKKLILRGMTNVEIAQEIGYSDSLVRQETMAIYAALNVSGRKELLENSGGGGGGVVKKFAA
jgi:DNA-binding CsgD family transcriptional regulator